MKAIFQSIYINYFLCALFLSIVAAWFSVGYYHPDEHWQILEFANYKLGKTYSGTLPWEFRAQIRPALQVFIAYSVMKFLAFLGINNPFSIAFFLRLITGIITWFVTCKLVLFFMNDFKTKTSKKIFIGLSFFLWFIPYLSVRFSSENMAAGCFMLSIYLLLKSYNSLSKKNISYVCIGGLLALSFFFRFQMAFAFIGLAAWLLYFKQINFKNSVAVIFSFLLVSSVCVCIDKWFYGAWVFTPYKYYTENITHHVADKFGVSPWWQYFIFLAKDLIVPFSLVLLYFFGVGWYKNKQHVFSFIVLVFFVAHMAVSHKETRFLFPLVFAFAYLTAKGIEFYLPKITTHKFLRVLSVMFIIGNVGMLLYRTLIPSQETVLFYKNIYTTVTKPTKIISVRESMYSNEELKITFYRPKNIEEIIVKDIAELHTYLKNNTTDTLFIFRKDLYDKDFPASYKSQRILASFPDWILFFNINNWESRASIWCMYQLTPTQNLK